MIILLKNILYQNFNVQKDYVKRNNIYIISFYIFVYIISFYIFVINIKT